MDPGLMLSSGSGGSSHGESKHMPKPALRAYAHVLARKREEQASSNRTGNGSESIVQ